ncbi:putative nucleotidyltransferase, ribonuclease H [Tanacetum coccineum]
MTGDKNGGDKNLSDVLKGIDNITTMLQNLTTCVEHTEAELKELRQTQEGWGSDDEFGSFTLRQPRDDFEGLFEANHEPARRQNQREDFHLKVDLSFFNGNLNIKDFLDWIAEVERFFEFVDIPENKQVKLVAYRLKGWASSWWEQVQNQRKRVGKQPTRSWPKMKRMLMGRFLPLDYDQFLFEQYQSLRQGQKSVADYTAEFLRLSSRNNLMEAEGQQISRYLYGLKPSMREKIGCQVILSLSEAHNIARKAESMSSKGNLGDEVSRRSSTDGSKQPLKFNAVTSTSSNTIQSEQTEKEGGKIPMVNPYAKPIRDKCYRCGIPRHRSNVCPQRKQVNLAKYDENKNEGEDDYFKEDDGVCQPDGGEEDMPTFVVRNVLLAPKRVDTQRNMLFRTRCTISNQIFDLIIDGGSCENIISHDLVHKLKLPVEKHSEPYSIVWITDSAGIRVIERCRVPLSIGKFYKDEVLCDVVDMNACHLLFGRPWQYDLEITHDGKDNIYRFVKDGKKITLLPLGFKQNSEPQKVEKLLTISRVGTEFVCDLKDSKEVHLLIVKDFLSVGRDKSMSAISSVILQLLSSSRDIMPEELPNELPP